MSDDDNEPRPEPVEPPQDNIPVDAEPISDLPPMGHPEFKGNPDEGEIRTK